MKNLPKELLIHAFVTSQLKGSPQHIRFMPSLTQLGNITQQLCEGIDYTQAYFDGKDKVYVEWRNHANTIQFCGSAAFAIGDYLLHFLNINHIEIIAPNIQLKAVRTERYTRLQIPSSRLFSTAITLDRFGKIYQQSNGIYFIETKSRKQLTDLNLTDVEINHLPLPNPQGLCFFFWDSTCQTGYVRYFNPWYGRHEDHVTGSIQSALTTHSAKNYGVFEQQWYQLSSNGGYLKTSYSNNKVNLEGSCHY